MKKIAILLPLLLTFTLLQGCHSSSSNSQSTVRLVNGTANALNMSWVQSGAASAVAVDITYASASSSVSATDGVSSIDLTNYSDNSFAWNGSFSFSGGTSYTLVAIPPAVAANSQTNTLGVVQLVDNQTAPNSGYAILDIVDKSEAGSLDVYVLPTSATVPTSPAALAQGITGSSAYTILASTTSTPSTYHIRVTGANAGYGNDIRLDIPSVIVGNQQILTLVLSPSAGGALVDGLVIYQQGQTLLTGQYAQTAVTGYKNYSARVRVVTNLQAGGSVTSAAGNVGSNAPTTIASNMSSPSVGYYTVVPLASISGAQTLNVSVTTNSVTTPCSASVSSGEDVTLLVLGSSSNPTCSLLIDNNTLPTSPSANLRLVNAINSINGPISLSVDSMIPNPAITANYGFSSVYYSLPAQSGSGTAHSLTVNTTGTNYTGAQFVVTPTFIGQNVNTLFVFGDLSTSSSTPITGLVFTDITQKPSNL